MKVLLDGKRAVALNDVTIILIHGIGTERHVKVTSEGITEEIVVNGEIDADWHKTHEEILSEEPSAF